MPQFESSQATRFDTNRMKHVKILEELIRLYPAAIPVNPIYGTIQPTKTDTLHVLKIKQNEVLSAAS